MAGRLTFLLSYYVKNQQILYNLKEFCTEIGLLVVVIYEEKIFISSSYLLKEALYSLINCKFKPLSLSDLYKVLIIHVINLYFLVI